MIDKLIYLILHWSSVFSDFVTTSLYSSVNYVCNTAWNHLPKWKSTPHVRQDKNRHKTSHGAGKFLQKFAIAKSQATINVTVNQGDTIAYILSSVVSHGRFVKIRIRNACQIWI